MNALYFAVLAIYFLTQVTICAGMCDQRPFGGNLTCCDGKNSKCFVKVQSHRNRGQTNTICYCDNYCKLTNDCCPDYQKVSKICKGAVQDCEMGEWGAWGSCSSTCGFGVMKRTRKVLVQPTKGGKKCPAHRQTRGCNLNNICNDQKQETAFILPITYRRKPFGQFHFENILPVQKDQPAAYNAPTNSYCVHYKLLYKRSQCDNSWANVLEETVPVCVECQSRVMDGGHCRGEGELGVRTRWKALGVNRCHGHWVRLGPLIPNCTCDESYFSNFVFV